MHFKKFIGIQFVFSLFILAACNNTPKDQVQDDIEIISESELQAFMEDKEEVVRKLDYYIAKIDGQLSVAEEESKGKLEMAKSEAKEMKRNLLDEYSELTNESSEQWILFKNQVEKFLMDYEDDLAELTGDESK